MAGFSGKAGWTGLLSHPLLRGTKGQILRLLRGRERTADEIAAALDVTANGARFHLTELERDGLVAQRSVRRGARKPSHGYSLAPGGEALFPKRYDALLNAVLREARRGLWKGDTASGADGLGGNERENTETRMRALFRRLGLQLAQEHAYRFAGRSPEERVEEALRVVGELGGAADLAGRGDAAEEGAPSGGLTQERDAGSPAARGVSVVEGRSCPFAAVVPEHPEVCALLEAFLEDVLPGAAIRETCLKDPAAGPPRCRFEIGAAPATQTGP
jgi:predicted ArsR family transcriptional regulator